MLSERLVNTVARKKIVFVIVEGASDDEALGILLEKAFDRSSVYVHITHGDITSMPGTDPTQIITKVAEIVKTYAKSTHLTHSHFQEILHIVDTDGVFVPDDSIVEDPCVEKTIYSLTEIRTNNAHGIQLRNERKRLCLSRLYGAQRIWGIPYQVFYMSCNLDHVLHNKQNSTDEEKESDAFSFAKRYRDDLGGFIHFISESEFSVMSGYIESWNYIKQELHSLERHSNLGHRLKALYDSRSENDSLPND